MPSPVKGLQQMPKTWTDQLWADLDKPLLRFVAKGNTYRHREYIQSHAWWWDPAIKCWVNDSETTEDCFCIRQIANIPGVDVTCEGPIE